MRTEIEYREKEAHIRTPSVFLAYRLKEQKTVMVDGGPRIVRPVNSRQRGLCLKWRLLMAWRVFTGRYDALSWEDRRM